MSTTQLITFLASLLVIGGPVTLGALCVLSIFRPEPPTHKAPHMTQEEVERTLSLVELKRETERAA
jgi:hypothetical protein